MKSLHRSVTSVCYFPQAACYYSDQSCFFFLSSITTMVALSAASSTAQMSSIPPSCHHGLT